ncbi:hypothetical protein [Actinoplanes sp. RD1]|uniref:hypothetical protein n=1 Tax=Actinoplanes sp. RD1 TaxID=3064538 RepID=UPI002741681C|nr:hypothetical protein [Actinoplanes sp. RD1]
MSVGQQIGAGIGVAILGAVVEANQHHHADPIIAATNGYRAAFLTSWTPRTFSATADVECLEAVEDLDAADAQELPARGSIRECRPAETPAGPSPDTS